MVQISSPRSPEKMSPHVQRSSSGRSRYRSQSPEQKQTGHFQSLDSDSSPSPSNMSSSGSINAPIHRKSHTKSRNGCKTCKKRHIRCDENIPQCRNCTKHNVRCAYMDEMDGVPDLGITSEVQRELDAWRVTGVYPFPTLHVNNQPSPARYSQTDLRLIHHISSIAVQMQAAEVSNRYAIWTRRVPMFLRIASSHDFVMHSLLGLSASHLSWLTESFATLQLAYQHRGEAFKGLQEAIGSFSKENSDAVLAASILLSWQVTDWRSWASLLRGTSTVIDSMRGWKTSSVFADIMDEQLMFSSSPHQRQPIPDPERDHAVVNHVYASLVPLRPYFSTATIEFADALETLIVFVEDLQTRISVASAEEQFELLHPLRGWLFFLPIDVLKAGRHDLSAMVLLANFFGVALAVEPLFPAVGAAFFGTMSVGPIEEIHQTLVHIDPAGRDVRTALGYMAFPLEMVHEFRQRMHWRKLEHVHPQHYVHPHVGYGVEPYSGGGGGHAGSGAPENIRASEVFASAMWQRN